MFNLPFESIFFAVFAALGIIFAILSVTTKKLIHSAVHLMFVLILFASYYLLIGTEFMAGIQLLLYVGGVLILVVFAVMVTSGNELNLEAPAPSRKFIALIASIGFFITSTFVFMHPFFNKQIRVPMANEIDKIGHSFLNYGSDGQIIAFELISLILLAALVGGIVIGRKDESQEDKA